MITATLTPTTSMQSDAELNSVESVEHIEEEIDIQESPLHNSVQYFIQQRLLALSSAELPLPAPASLCGELFQLEGVEIFDLKAAGSFGAVFGAQLVDDPSYKVCIKVMIFNEADL